MGIDSAKVCLILAKYEIKRRTALEKLLLTIVFYFIICVTASGLIFIIFFLDECAEYASYKIAVYIILIIAAIISILFIIPLCIGVLIKKNKAFINSLKNECLDEILKNFGDIHWGNKDSEKEELVNKILKEDINNSLFFETSGLKKNIRSSELKESWLFKEFNERNTDDNFYGNYKGVDFKISETQMSYVSICRKNRSTKETFQGVVISFKFNKPIKSRTIISTKGDTTYSVCKNQKELDNVELEDSEFSKKYNVYSENQVEARYLITPAFMERFKNLRTAFGTNKIKCSFFDDNFMIAISTSKNLFELGNIFTPLTNYKVAETCYRELDSIFKMIEYFKLNEKTGI